MKLRKELQRLNSIEAVKEFDPKGQARSLADVPSAGSPDKIAQIILCIVFNWGKVPMLQETFSVEQATAIATKMFRDLVKAYYSKPFQNASVEWKPSSRFVFWLFYNQKTSTLNTKVADDIERTLFEFENGIYVELR